MVEYNTKSTCIIFESIYSHYYIIIYLFKYFTHYIHKNTIHIYKNRRALINYDFMTNDWTSQIRHHSFPCSFLSPQPRSWAAVNDKWMKERSVWTIRFVKELLCLLLFSLSWLSHDKWMRTRGVESWTNNFCFLSCWLSLCSCRLPCGEGGYCMKMNESLTETTRYSRVI